VIVSKAKKRRTVDAGHRRPRSVVLDEVGLAATSAIDNRQSSIINAVPTPPPLVTRGPEPPGAPHWQPKPVEPAPELSPEQKQAARQKANADQTTLGVSGTANLLGFLHDLGEINVEFQGLKAMQKYDLMRRTDGTIAALEAVIRLLVRRAEWVVETGVEENDEGYALAKEIRDFVEENLKDGMEKLCWDGTTRTQTFESVIENATLAAPYGCAGHEYLWATDNDKNKIRLAGLAPRLPTTFYQFLCEPDGETLRTLVQFGYRGSMVQMAPVPANKIDIFTLNREGAYFYGRSVFRPVWRSYYAKTELIIIDLIGSERNRMAVPVIKQGPNATPDDKAQSWQWVENLSANERTGLSLPNGWEFALQGIEGRAITLTDSIKLHDEEILVGGLADFIALGRSASGSRALGDVKLELFLLAEQAFGNMIAAAMTHGAVRRLVDYNYEIADDQRNLYPRLRCAEISMVNVIDLVAAIKDLANSNVDWLQPTEDDENKLRRRLGMDEKAGPGRVKYAPIVERIQEMETGDEPIPTQSGEGEPEKTSPQRSQRTQSQVAQGSAAADPAVRPAGDTQPGQTSHVLPSGRAVVPAKERARQSQAVQASARFVQSADAFSFRPARVRNQVSPLWRDGDPAHLQKVHADETHIDFGAHLAHLERAEAAVKGAFERAKPRLMRSAATLFASRIQDSKFRIQDLISIAPQHDAELAREVGAILSRVHAAGVEEARLEHARLAAAGKLPSLNLDGVRLSDDGGTPALPSKPQLRAEIAVQDVIADIAQAARKAALDLAASDFEDESEQEIADEIYSQAADTAYVDEGISRTAAEAANRAFRGGRLEAQLEIESALRAAGIEPQFFRVGVLDKNICGNCEAADGQRCRPDADLSQICDGKDLCRCQVAEGAIG